MKAKKAPLRVLIIDDKPENIEAAKKQFAKVKGVEITTMDSFSIFKETFLPFGWGSSLTEKIRKDNKSAVERIAEYDVVLTDLFMPAAPEGINDDKFLQWSTLEIPYGIAIATFAKHAGIKNVGIVTNLNHHAGPFEWAMDLLPVCYLEENVMASGEEIDKRIVDELGKTLPVFSATITKFSVSVSDKPTGKKEEYQARGGKYDGKYICNETQKGWILVYNYLLGL